MVRFPDLPNDNLITWGGPPLCFVVTTKQRCHMVEDLGTWEWVEPPDHPPATGERPPVPLWSIASLCLPVLTPMPHPLPKLPSYRPLPTQEIGKWSVCRFIQFYCIAFSHGISAALHFHTQGHQSNSLAKIGSQGWEGFTWDRPKWEDGGDLEKGLL